MSKSYFFFSYLSTYFNFWHFCVKHFAAPPPECSVRKSIRNLMFENIFQLEKNF